ncbi:MAG: hypothetical protein IKI49_05200 [Oscillospiraceae bacterium]|nr:hypothetical protein [Oscillospiraceae bacterium]
MREAFGEWIRAVTGTAMLCAAAMMLLPDGKVKRSARLIFGFVMLFALLGILGRLKMPEYSELLTGSKYELSELVGELDKTNRELERAVIEERAAAYILDKGDACGATISGASVRAKWSEDGYWYPFSAEISADMRYGDVEYYIAAELGIAPENIIWNTGDMQNEAAAR